ncbi:DUF397 domain-containing protein [Streptomyces specialis]|uniref:DUF397 domain-containing protein n=1 Tax=Streptomyces specialis TaxID=498367 RepID=UPI00073F4C0C|nr:DUF397 domain-containing protein [Streptomyces specialis]
MTTDLNLTDAEWIKSSYSQGDGGQCVEFSTTFVTSGVVPVRDSKSPHGPAVVFPAEGWAQFLSAVRDGGPRAV